MSAAHDPPGCPTTWPCPFWRHIRWISHSESMALRAYARLGMPVPPHQPINVLDDYRPRTRLDRIGEP